MRINLGAVSCIVAGCPAGYVCQDDGTGSGNVICAPLTSSSGSAMLNPPATTIATGDLSDLPISSIPANSTLTASGLTLAAGAATPLSCPTGYTCSILNGVPDQWIYIGGGALLLLIGLAVLGGRRR